MHVESFPVQTMKVLQILLGKLGRSQTTTSDPQQLATSQLKSLTKNQGIQQVINDTQEARGTCKNNNE